MPSVATLIVARNAEETVGSAVESALAEPIDELVFVDDVSEDNTLDVVRSYADQRIRLLELEQHSTLGYARGCGLEAVQSDLCFLLDADDVFLPGRIDRLVSVLERQGTDFVADELALVDGASGKLIRRLTIPDFLDEPPGLWRLFERNYLPGIGQIGFRANSMKRIGYDAQFVGAEDADLVLRALAAGMRGSLVREVGYQMRHFPGSVSRDRGRQSAELAKVLLKHELSWVRDRFLEAGVSSRIADWAAYSLAVFQGDFLGAKRVLERLTLIDLSPDTVVDPRGPCPLREDWRLAFAEGTLALLMSESSDFAYERLVAASLVRKEADLLNNMGVAHSRLGRPAEAGECFAEALALKPGYADARENLSCVVEASRITSHPLRREPSRSEY